MKTRILSVGLAFLAASLLAADSNPKDTLASSAKKLAQDGYSWKTTREFANFNSTSEGKVDKAGLVWLSMTLGENTTTAFLKESKGAVKRADQDWQSLADLAANAGEGRGQFLPRMLKNFKAPAAEVEDILTKVKEIKQDGEVCSADLTEEGAKSLLTFGRRQPNAPEPRNAKASVKFWAKAGQITKYELKVQGTVNFNNEDRDIESTTTVELKDIGATKVEMPEEAKGKMA